MKAYTDIEQSKKLAELLPLESADLMWEYEPHKDTFRDKPTIIPNDSYIFINDIPCWSLVALYSVLPSFTLDSSDDKYFRIHCCKKFSEWYNNPIDAAFEMILKLHGQKLL